MEIRFNLGKYGKRLWTRVKAREIRPELTSKLDKIEVGGTLVIDTAEVEVFDFSFANELFGKTLLGLRAEYPGRFVIVENLSSYTRENLDQALTTLGLAMIERIGTRLSLIGKLHPVDQETFETIVKSGGRATASALAGEMKVNLTAMNERLSKLISLGVARRGKSTSDAGREQFEYRVLA